MPQQIGPDMLAHLDRQLADGSMDPHTYEARKLEVQELIRKGNAFTLGRGEKIMWSLIAAFFILLGVVVAFAGNIFSLILGLAMFVFGSNRLAMVVRH